MLTSPKWLLRIEGLVVLIVSVVVYRELSYSWGKFALLFFVPDIFMVGYLVDTKIGAVVYNFGHTYVAPILFLLLVYILKLSSLYFITLIWVAHIGFDRLLGYGLKYPTAFKDTHLGKV